MNNNKCYIYHSNKIPNIWGTGSENKDAKYRLSNVTSVLKKNKTAKGNKECPVQELPYVIGGAKKRERERMDR